MLKVPVELESHKANGDDGDCIDVEVKYKFITVGLARFTLKGTLLVYLRPLLSRVPFLGGVEIAFENKPEISIDFTGIGSVVDIPGLNDMVFSLIDNVLAKFLVLPNRFPLTWDPPSVLDPLAASQLRCPAPEGVLRVKIIRANDLAADDVGIVSSGSSDPYVLIKLGSQSGRTPVIAGTLDPIWETDITFDLLVYDREQLVDIEVFDYDAASSDDPVGKPYDRTVQELLGEHWGQTHTVELGEKRGTLTFHAQWLDALADGELCNIEGARALLSRQGGHDQKTHLQYCGRVVGKSRYQKLGGFACTTPMACDGVCGPMCGCQCHSCHALDYPTTYKVWFCAKTDEFCIKNDGFVLKMMDFAQKPDPDDPLFDTTQPMDYPIRSASDVHHVAVSSRDGEHLDLANDSVIVSARVGLPGEMTLDVTHKLHHLFVKGHRGINAKSFNWDRIQKEAGQQAAPTPEGVLRIEILRANGPCTQTMQSSVSESRTRM